MTIGYKIRKLRENKSYTQQYMAEQLGISQKAYSKIESDSIKPSEDKLVKIAELMEVELNSLKNFDLDRVTFKDNSNMNGGWTFSGDIHVTTTDALEKLIQAKDEIIKLQADKIKLLEERKSQKS